MIIKIDRKLIKDTIKLFCYMFTVIILVTSAMYIIKTKVIPKLSTDKILSYSILPDKSKLELSSSNTSLDCDYIEKPISNSKNVICVYDRDLQGFLNVFSTKNKQFVFSYIATENFNREASINENSSSKIVSYDYKITVYKNNKKLGTLNFSDTQWQSSDGMYIAIDDVKKLWKIVNS